MSVTVEDLLKLPSLRNAEVLAGSGGLQKIVSSISVLETVDPEVLNDALFPTDKFYGSEIVITAFFNSRDDVELQCRNIKRLSEGGEVGLILFYVGSIMKSIDPRLTAIADELDFTLICMPRNRLDLRYSEVICDVMEAIFKDQSASTTMVVDLLDRVSSLPQHQQTIDTVLKMLAERIRATVILTDSEYNVLNEAAWPRTLSGLHKHLREAVLTEGLEYPASFAALPGSIIYMVKVPSESPLDMKLFIINENEPLNNLLLQQAAEIVRLAIRIWSQKHDQVVISELVNAILQDEPLKMIRLAALFHIDVASVDAMWVFAAEEASCSLTADNAAEMREIASSYCKTAFADLYENYLLLFLDRPHRIGDCETLLRELILRLPPSVYVTVFANLRNTSAVRQAFLYNNRYVADARRIFNRRSCFCGEEILFAKSCREIVDSGEAMVDEAMAAFKPLAQERDFDELQRTLSVFFLDAGSSISETARLMYLHQNTIKYRLKSITNALGFRIGDMPASYRIFQAVAIDRLLKGSPAKKV